MEVLWSGVHAVMALRIQHTGLLLEPALFDFVENCVPEVEYEDRSAVSPVERAVPWMMRVKTVKAVSGWYAGIRCPES